MNEWEFTGEVKSWIDQIIQRNTTLPFGGAKVEQTKKGSKKRRDLTLIDRDGNALLTGEIKIPDAPDGTTPYRAEVVRDARQKAERAGVKFFFTWNVNECVLWETATAGSGLQDRAYERWAVTSITQREQLANAPVQHAIYEWLVRFLHDAARIMQSGAMVGSRSPDIKFVEALESALTLPIRHTFEALTKLYDKKPPFKRDIDQWMVSLGWTIVSDPEGLRELLERAAKFGCYLLVNKLVFHEARLKKYGKKLDALNAPPEITTGDELRQRLHLFFTDAREITGDYETIFGDAPLDIENRIPFYSDFAVSGWRGLIDQIHEFDFSKLDYEVVGSIFERLIGPEERHKYGQFYTRVEVVDLINSFCIRDGRAVVLDPACGGGTFLVRAYARKRALAGNRNHKDLLSDIYGVDVSQFAAHLTTMNLATRDLVQDENYPCIGRADFFDVLPDTPFVKLPTKLRTAGLGKNTYRDVKIPPLDAAIANPPYVRQEEIKKAKKKPKDGGPERATKEFYRKRAKEFSGADLSGRSDLHCYFWPHVTTFLKEGGMLGFITSSQWLDVEYGFKLQGWLLQNYEILAILESPVEPWFVGARVATAVTIARRCSDAARRDANTVRFIQLRKPLSELVEHDGSTAGAIVAADQLRDEILGLTENVSHHRYRARLIPQGELWQDGVTLKRLMRGEDAEIDDEDIEVTDSNREAAYFGSKWGIQLRAPDLWFELLEKFGSQLVPFGQSADIRFGVKSGKDEFFFPRDCSSDCLTLVEDPVDFEREYGTPREKIVSGEIKLVMAGAKSSELHAIESKYLEPEVHSLMEIDSFTVTSKQCGRMILLAPSKIRQKTFAEKYISWGESKNFHKAATCVGRESEDVRWYDLTHLSRPSVILPKIQQYRLIAFLNPENLYQNSSLLGIYGLDENDAAYFAGLLNSTICVLVRILFARGLGNEGNTQLDVYSAKMMPVPTNTSRAKQEKIGNLFLDGLASRKALSFISERRMRQMAYERAGKTDELAALSDISELDMPDRRNLDHAVFEMLGIASKRERDVLIDRLYDYLRQFFEDTRRKEELAIANKNVTKRKGAVSPQDVATQIAQILNDEEPQWFEGYREILRLSGIGQNWQAYDTPFDGIAEVHSDMLDVGIRFLKGSKEIGFVSLPSLTHAQLATTATNEKRQELVKLPRMEDDARSVLKAFSHFLTQRDKRLRELIAERVADEDVQHKILDLLLTRIRQGATAPEPMQF